MPVTTPSDSLDHAQKLLCELLRQKREERKLTIRQVAHRLGRSKSWVVRSESGERKLSMEELIAFSKLYEVDPGDLLRTAMDALQLSPEE